MIKLVIVDDQSTIREFLRIHLDSRADISVVALASNGKEAISVVEKHQPDIVLMDIEMPIMNGIEASQIISKNFIDVMVVLFTTREDKQQLNLALKAGARGYVLKTTNTQDLVNIIYLTLKGFLSIGPILGNWNEESTFTTIEAKPDKILNLSPKSTLPDLSVLTNTVLELKEAIRSQETQIVNLTNRFAREQTEINSSNGRKLLNSKSSERAPVKYYYFDKKRQNTLFISGFLLGAIMVVLILILYIAVKSLG